MKIVKAVLKDGRTLYDVTDNHVQAIGWEDVATNLTDDEIETMLEFLRTVDPYLINQGESK